jgi:catechol 2,3-dioxygenase-like lactoylglutathione lyase family enzyme
MLINTGSLPVDGSIYQIGVVVPDLGKGIDNYSRLLGLKNWKRLDTDYIGRYRDWEGRIANHNAFAQWGAIHLEMIEPCVGETNAMEWLRTKGTGMFHIGVAVDDVRIRPEDFEVVFEVKSQTQPDGSPAIIHLDTVNLLGYFIELTYRPLADALSSRVASSAPWD